MGGGGQREEILCPDMGPPWASAPLGPSLLWCGECSFNVLCLAMSPDASPLF